MKGLAITSKGIEDIAALEIKELIDAKCEIEETCVIFDFKKFEDLCLLCYKAQSVDRILYLLGDFEFDNFFDNFKNHIEKLKFDGWVSKGKNFKVECIRIGDHNFKSVDVEEKAAQYIKSKNKKFIFSIKSPDIIFFVYIFGNKCYFGVDFAGFELNKRSYKIFLHSNSLRGTIAYALIKKSGFEKEDVMLDPFSRDGVISIEAALYAADFPVNYYKKDKFAFLRLNLGIDYEKFFRNIDKKPGKTKPQIYSFDHMFKFVDYSKKNAKIAGVDKQINFSRVELEWLDIKFNKESVDRIISGLPSSKNINLEKIHNEFFYQAEYVLKKDGIIGVITKMPDFAKKYAEKYKFAVLKEKNVWSGEQPLSIIIFKRKY